MRVGRCRVWPGLRSAKGRPVGGTERMPPPIMPPPMPPMPPPMPPMPPPIMPPLIIMLIIRLRMSQLSYSPQKYMIKRPSVIRPIMGGMVPPPPPMPPRMPPPMPPPIPPPMPPPIPPPMPPMPPMPPPPMPPIIPPICPVALWAMMPGGSTTRSGLWVRLVTETVIRPSLRPSAWTDTFLWRMASSRLTAGGSFSRSFGAVPILAGVVDDGRSPLWDGSSVPPAKAWPSDSAATIPVAATNV